MSVLPFPAGEPGRDLLQLPGVAVRVAERRPREVRAPRRVEARGPRLLHLADLDAAADEIVPGGVDVLDDQDQAISGSRLSRGAGLAELDRALRVGRRELNRPDVVADDQVDVEPPSEALIEALCPIDIGDRQRHDLEFHVHDLNSLCSCLGLVLASRAEPPGLGYSSLGVRRKTCTTSAASISGSTTRAHGAPPSQLALSASPTNIPGCRSPSPSSTHTACPSMNP